MQDPIRDSPSGGGVAKLARAVRVTMAPRGRSVVIQNRNDSPTA